MTTFRSLPGKCLGTALRVYAYVPNRRAYEAILASHVVRYPAPSDNHEIDRAFIALLSQNPPL